LDHAARIPEENLSMSTFARNIIVTCGTSQLDLVPKSWKDMADKLQTLDEKTQIAEDTVKHIAEATFSVTVELFQKEYGFLSKEWQHLDDRVWKGKKNELKNNPFGAEVSSLVLMLKEPDPDLGRYGFDPQADRLTVLYSDTLTGAFCAALLCRLASEQWLMGPVDWAFRPGPQPASHRIRAIRVEGLSEEVADPQRVDNVFTDRIQDAMRPRSDVGADAIVYTGGFKFMIPILTAFAIAHEVDLYYRYEKVYQIRKTHVPPIFSEGIKRAFMNVPEAEKSGNPILRAIGSEIGPPGQRPPQTPLEIGSEI
jgi:CRISPR-associated protein (Cas_APE2256)